MCEYYRMYIKTTTDLIVARRLLWNLNYICTQAHTENLKGAGPTYHI